MRQRYRVDGSDYLEMLGLLYRVVDANRGSSYRPSSERDIHAEALATKFFMHAVSILYLSRGISVPEFPGVAVKSADPASINVLTRSAIEAFLTFHFVFSADATQDELGYRYLTYVRCGLKERQEYQPTAEEHMQKLAGERLQLDELCGKLRLNGFFKRLASKQQAQALRLNTWRQRLVDGQFKTVSWREIADAAGFSTMISEHVYRYLSGHAHSSSASLFQVRQWPEETNGSLVVPISLMTIFTANLIHEYAALFPLAKKALDVDTGKNKVDEWRQIGRVVGDNEYG